MKVCFMVAFLRHLFYTPLITSTSAPKELCSSLENIQKETANIKHTMLNPISTGILVKSQEKRKIKQAKVNTIARNEKCFFFDSIDLKVNLKKCLKYFIIIRLIPFL